MPNWTVYGLGRVSIPMAIGQLAAILAFAGNILVGNTNVFASTDIVDGSSL